MNEWDQEERGELDMIADAVRAYPLVSAPPGLAPAIMARVRESVPAPRFELKWIDLALGLFGAGMMGLVFLLLWQWLPNWPDWVNDIVPNVLVPSALVSLDRMDITLGAIGIIGGLVALGVCLIIALALLVPRPVVHLEAASR